MSLTLRISLIIGIAFYLLFIIYLLRNKKLTLKYSLLWILTAVVMLVMSVFPKLVNLIAECIGVVSSINAIFMAFIFMILLILISLSSIVSKQHKQIKTLIQHLAVHNREITDLKDSVRK